VSVSSAAAKAAALCSPVLDSIELSLTYVDLWQSWLCWPVATACPMLIRLLYVVLIAGLILGFILLLRDPGVQALLRAIIR
jgi:hypothetical protein